VATWGGATILPRRVQPCATDMPCEAALSGGTLPIPHSQRIGHRPSEPSDKQLWANIYSIEVTSKECLTRVQTLLSCRSGINAARSFQGNEAQMFIDLLDQVSCESCAQCLGNLLH